MPWPKGKPRSAENVARMRAGVKAAFADPTKGPKHLRHLSGDQRETYRLYRRKGFSVAEALAAVMVATPPCGRHSLVDAADALGPAGG